MATNYTHKLVVCFQWFLACCIQCEVAWVHVASSGNTYCSLNTILWQHKSSLASGLRPRPRRFTAAAINSDVVVNLIEDLRCSSKRA